MSKNTTDSISKVFKYITGARDAELLLLPEVGPKRTYGLHLVWNLELDLLQESKEIANSIESFWEKATVVISLPKVAALETELRHAQNNII